MCFADPIGASRKPSCSGLLGGSGSFALVLGAFGTFCCTADEKNSGFCLFFPFSQLQQEKAEWENLNKALMRHGLKPVSLAAPQSCRDASGKEM